MDQKGAETGRQASAPTPTGQDSETTVIFRGGGRMRSGDSRG